MLDGEDNRKCKYIWWKNTLKWKKSVESTMEGEIWWTCKIFNREILWIKKNSETQILNLGKWHLTVKDGKYAEDEK